jgi:hypothetical protein
MPALIWAQVEPLFTIPLRIAHKPIASREWVRILPWILRKYSRIVGISMPNVRLMARPLLPEQTKAIRETSRGVRPYFWARKQTRQPSEHAGSPAVVDGKNSNPASEVTASGTTLRNL